MKTKQEYEAAAMLLGMSYQETTRSFWHRDVFGSESHYDRDTMRRLPFDEAVDRAGEYWQERVIMESYAA